MSKMGIRVAAVAMMVGALGAVAPAASAQDIEAAPCEAYLGQYVCQQIADTGQFVADTIGRVEPAVAEWRERVADLGDYAWATVRCYLSGPCSPIQP